MGLDKTTTELALEALPEGIILLDDNKRVLFSNKNARVLFPLIESNKLLGDSYHRICQDMGDYIDSALAGTISNIDRYSIRNSGEKVILHVFFYPLAGAGKTHPKCLMVIRDITEQLDLNADLEYRFEQINKQLTSARKYQDALFTREYADENLVCEAFGQPAIELSGDFFNISQVKDRYLFLLGDVQGHGIDVAMKAVMLQQLCLMSIGAVPVAANIMKGLNDFISKDQQDEFWTCCMFIGCYDPLAKTLYYARAGVPEPILVRKNSNVEVLTSGDMPLGYFAGENYHNGMVFIESGDRLLMFTDGLIEIGREGEYSSLFGHDELQKAYLEFCSIYPGHNWDKIIKVVEEYHGSTNFPDDLTIAEVIFS